MKHGFPDPDGHKIESLEVIVDNEQGW